MPLIRLPDFLVLGANRAGTTALFNWIMQHPDVYGCDAKEPMFFNTPGPRLDEQRDRDRFASYPVLKDYLDLFAQAPEGQKIGEASTGYLAFPGESASLIAKMCADVRMVAILREPVERAISAYALLSGVGFETRSFEQALRDELNGEQSPPNSQRYIAMGAYHLQLWVYFQYFPRSQILIEKYENLVADPESVVRKVYEHIEVDPGFKPDCKERFNESGRVGDKPDLAALPRDLLKLIGMAYHTLYEELPDLVPFDVGDWKDRLASILQ